MFKIIPFAELANYEASFILSCVLPSKVKCTNRVTGTVHGIDQLDKWIREEKTEVQKHIIDGIDGLENAS